MSLYINFEPHSWYKGFAIKDNRLNYDEPEMWQAYTDDGMTYRVIKLSSLELQGLKHLITLYRSK